MAGFRPGFGRGGMIHSLEVSEVGGGDRPCIVEVAGGWGVGDTD